MSNFVVCLPTYLAVLENKANKVFNQKSLVEVGFNKTARHHLFGLWFVLTDKHVPV